MAVHFTVGPKPQLSWPEYDRAQNYLRSYLKKCVALPCTYVLTAHQAREQSEVAGGTILTVDTIGVKLAPKLLKMFDEIIVTSRSGNKYAWSTDTPGIDLKSRRLPYANNIEPDFAQMWR
jgi:hypothetical protein